MGGGVQNLSGKFQYLFYLIFETLPKGRIISI